jgi:hypothetical protein
VHLIHRTAYHQRRFVRSVHFAPRARFVQRAHFAPRAHFGGFSRGHAMRVGYHHRSGGRGGNWR